MIPVADALAALFALVTAARSEEVPLLSASGRVLLADVVAGRDQPPFAAAAMDGYALRAADLQTGAALRIVGQSAAGRRHDGTVGPGQAVRIFTGAPVPPGADIVILQEDAAADGDRVTPGPRADRVAGANIRPAGNDFRAGARIAAGHVLTPADIALAAAMGHARLTVARRPVVAILPTGDELVQPGESAGPDQIFSSNGHGLHALVAAAGAVPRLLPVARDDATVLDHALALADDADLVLTIGGASVGDHDLVAPALRARGAELSFHRVAMRPGKPLLAGRMGSSVVIGLPGNPVSAMICGTVFVLPVIRAMLGLAAAPARRMELPLAAALPANGPREHYLRGRIIDGQVQAFDRQDSSLLSVLAAADCLIVQPPGDPGRPAGALVEIIHLPGNR